VRTDLQRLLKGEDDLAHAAVLPRFFPSRGVYHEIESFAEKIKAVKDQGTPADSATARNALLDLAFIQACLSEDGKWQILKEL
jgi:hypothetical protein